MVDGTAQEIGVAYVSVVPSTRGFTGKLREQLSPELTSAGASSAERFAGGFASNLGALKALAATAGAAVALSFGEQSLRAFAEAEQAQVQLQRVLGRFPALADTNLERLKALNVETERKAAVDGDELAAAQARLALFGLTGRELEKLTPILADYVAFTGEDAASAAETLGKAMKGQARGLKALGIDFQTTGNRAADLQRLIDILSEKVGGAGEDFRNSAAGGLKAFEVGVGNLQEAIGEQLAPSLGTAVDALNALEDITPALLDDVTTLRESFALLGDAVDIKLPDWMTNGTQVPSVLDFLPGTQGVNEALDAFRNANPFRETDAAFRELGVTIDRATGKVTASGAAMKYIQSLAPGTVLTVDGLRDALQAAGEKSSDLATQVNASAAAFSNADPAAAAYVATIERLGNFTLSDDARRALDATFGSDEEKRGRAQDANRNLLPTIGDTEREYWEQRNKAAEEARKAAEEASKRAREARERLAKEALEAARREAELRRQEIAAFVKGVQDEITRYGAITQFQPRGLFAPTASTITADMRARVAKARAFFPLIARLSRLGLNRSSLLEIIQAGPTAGTEIAQALLAGGARSVREVNALEAQLKSAGASIAGVASAAQFGGQATANVSVAVYIGNEQLDGHIDTRIAANARTTQQTARRGTRF